MMLRRFAFVAAVCAFSAASPTPASPTPASPTPTPTTRPADYGTAEHQPALRIPPTTEPLVDVWMRDTYITRGPDGYFYLTGTTADPTRTFDEMGPHCWDWNDGLYLWRSPDLKEWESLGRVWSLDADATWQSGFTMRKKQRNPAVGYMMDAKRRAVWAPELHYIESAQNWFYVACMNTSAGGQGSFILRSTTGKPEGPYENIEGNEDGPIFDHIDGSLFEEEDGTVYFVGHNHFYAKMKPDMSGLAEPMRRFKETPYEPEPYIEGAYVVKHDGMYHLIGAVWSFKTEEGSYVYSPANERDGRQRWSYDMVIASAPNFAGPYGPRYTAGAGIGHNNLFRDTAGNWYATLFGNPRGKDQAELPFLCRPAVVPMNYADGEFKVDAR